MMVHRGSRIAFALVPRAASTSIREYLSQLGYQYPLVKTNTPPGYLWHPPYGACIEQYPEVRSYKVYGVFRNPVDRFVSGLRYVRREAYFSKDKSLDEMVEELFNWDIGARLSGIRAEIFSSQTLWLDFDHVSVIPYSGVEIAIENITSLHNPRSLKMQKLNSSLGGPSEVVSEAVSSFARQLYAEDFSFAQRAGLI